MSLEKFRDEHGCDPCLWIFKGESCGYTGEADSCDKSPVTCKKLGNIVRWGGGTLTDPKYLAKRSEKNLAETIARWRAEDGSVS